MIAQYIKRVRRAEPAVRTRHAFLWASSVTVLAAVVWVTSLSHTLRFFADPELTPEAERPVASFFARAKEQFAAVGAQLSDQSGVTPVVDSSSNEEVISGTTVIELSPDDLATARARSSIDYQPVATTSVSTTTPKIIPVVATGTQPRVVRIATSSTQSNATIDTQ